MDALPNFEKFCDGAERSDLEKIKHELDMHYEPLRRLLGNEEILALRHYKNMGYKEMNDLMRNYTIPGMNDYALEMIENMVDRVKIAFSGQTLPFSTVTYRGLKREYPPADLAVGDYLTDLAFMSTTLSARFARQVCLWETNVVPSTIYEISVPEGTPAIWLDGILNKDEYELLLGYGTTVHISAINDLAGYPGRRYVRCQCVQLKI